MARAYVVSDLHMFSGRSHWERHLADIDHAAADADIFVFNGDTFDFKWSNKSSLEATVDAAITFLRELAQRHPKCHFHINLGNHDHVDPFIHELKNLAFATLNLTWHQYFYRVGETVFLHGDAAQRRMTHQQLQKFRAHWGKTHKPRGAFPNRLYDAAIQAKAHVALSKVVYPQQRTLEHVAAYLEDVGLTVEEGVRQVYFGHTHVSVDGVEFAGLTFHNGGAPMPGMDFTLLRTTV